jgi:hypothetical protein
VALSEAFAKEKFVNTNNTKSEKNLKYVLKEIGMGSSIFSKIEFTIEMCQVKYNAGLFN